MKPSDVAAVLLVILVWGLNFLVIKAGVTHVPPLLLGALRFLLAAFPALLFFKPPAVPLRLYLAYGLTISVGQFAFLFVAIHQGMPTGLASLVLQSQALFTLLLATTLLKERWHRHQLIGLGLALAGLVFIGTTRNSAMPLVGFVLTLMAAAMWAAGNIVSRKLAAHGPFNQLAFVIWASLVPPLPFLALSWYFEGGEAIQAAIAGFDTSAALSLLYLAWGATLLGYGIWTRLLSHYPANQVAPFSLLVPLVGLLAGWIVLDETLQTRQWLGAAILLAGLLVNVLGHRWRGPSSR